MGVANNIIIKIDITTEIIIIIRVPVTPFVIPTAVRTESKDNTRSISTICIMTIPKEERGC